MYRKASPVPVPQRRPGPRERALPVRLERDRREPLALPDPPEREVREEPAAGGGRREHARPCGAPPFSPLVEGLDQQRRGEHDADAARERGERSRGAGHHPSPPPSSPERRHGQEEEQGFAVRHEEEVGRREQAHQEHGGPRGAFGELGRGEEVGDDQPAPEGGVRHDGRRGERVSAQHEREPADRERVEREEGGAPVSEAIAALGDPQEPQRVEPLPGRERVLPSEIDGLGGPARHADGAERREQRDAHHPDDEHRDAEPDERDETEPDRAKDALASLRRVGDESFGRRGLRPHVLTLERAPEPRPRSVRGVRGRAPDRAGGSTRPRRARGSPPARSRRARRPRWGSR